MILREHPDGLFVITQPAHAWLSGEMARAWGNELTGSFEPWDETCLGAEQHDLGWLDWEIQPTWNPQTGKPCSFMELSTPEHIAIWTRGPRLAGLLNPYAGLLVSLHGTGLYARYRSDSPDPAVKGYMADESARQARLVAALSKDSRYSHFVTPEVLERNRTLVAAWDLLSLHVCLKRTAPLRVEKVPGAGRPFDLEMTFRDADTWRIDPWPFRGPVGELHLSGRLLHPPFPSEPSMREALDAAPYVTIPLRLEGGPGS